MEHRSSMSDITDISDEIRKYEEEADTFDKLRDPVWQLVADARHQVEMMQQDASVADLPQAERSRLRLRRAKARHQASRERVAHGLQVLVSSILGFDLAINIAIC